MMKVPIPVYELLYLDIETVSTRYRFEELSEAERKLWAGKARFWIRADGDQEDALEEAYRSRAAILAEFGRVVCITMGFLSKGHQPDEDTLRLKSWCATEEKEVLAPFADLLRTSFGHPGSYGLCGHNLREFDIPYLCRRMLVNGMPLPPMLDIAGRKPWEVKHLVDTMELWKFGDIKHYTSLDLLTHCLGIPSPKQDISGADVGRVFYEDQDLDALITYCEGDVVAVAQVMRRFSGLPLLSPDRITRAQ